MSCLAPADIGRVSGSREEFEPHTGLEGLRKVFLSSLGVEGLELERDPSTFWFPGGRFNGMSPFALSRSEAIIFKESSLKLKGDSWDGE